MKILHLNVFRKWFDMVESGNKTEDYREIGTYWISRFIDFYCGRKIKTEKDRMIFIRDIKDNTERAISKIQWKHFDTIKYQNGFKRKNGDPAPFIRFVFSGIKIDNGNPKLGYISGRKCFIIKLKKSLKGLEGN